MGSGDESARFRMWKRTIDLQQGNGSVLCLVLVLSGGVYFLLPAGSSMRREWRQEMSQGWESESVAVLG